MHYLNGLIDGYLYTVDVLEKNNACKYYDTVFNQHLSVWLSDVALSETIDMEDKKILNENVIKNQEYKAEQVVVLKEENKLAIIMGTEGDGLSSEVISQADYVVRIPMSHEVDSLNVAAASAVAFWELRKK